MTKHSWGHPGIEHGALDKGSSKPNAEQYFIFKLRVSYSAISFKDALNGMRVNVNDRK